MGIRDDLEDTYGENATPAEALFFKNKKGDPSFRLEVPRLALEFAYGTYIGKDPFGTFFYKPEKLKLLNQGKGALTSASFSVHRVSENGDKRHWAHVKFYARDSSSDILGEFLGRDEKGHVSQSGFETLGLLSGSWENVAYISSSAEVSKSDVEFTLTSEIKKCAKFSCDRDGELHNSNVKNVKGSLVVKSQSGINEAKTVRWTSDNLVFYINTNATIVSGYFSLASEATSNQLGEDKRRELEYDVTWTDT